MRCHNSDDLFWLKYPPGKTLIIGASYVALESAGALHGMGFDVTVMVRSIFLRGYDQEMAERIGAYLGDKKINIHRGAIPIEVKCINPVDYQNQQPGLFTVKYKFNNPSETEIFEETFNTVMVAIGRVACTSNLGLESLGISLDSKFRVISVDNREQTNCANIFTIGDILAGKPQLTPVAVKAGQLLAKRLCFESFENCDYNIVPTTVFTPLEYGAIGYSEEDAIAKFGEEDIDVYYNYCEPLEDKIVEETNHEAFYAKLVCRISQMNKVIGLHILSPNAGEITQGYTVAMRMGATLIDFNRTFGIHPTVSEVFTSMKVSKKSGAKVVAGGC
uniref:thioredoxin-disulfide reductase (NADPH) n=1 Tax=Henneguya salminicola TaxID=69463 RepID=A0A6G3MFX3_HENSL